MTPRIVSLLPSATKIVRALGFQDALVGRSHECDFPPGVAHLPVLTAPKIRREGTRAIHAAISEILGSDISVYRVDAELLRRLAPTHVITQIQCEVCAASLREPRLVETLEIVAEILAPTAFQFGHEGIAWQRCAD